MQASLSDGFVEAVAERRNVAETEARLAGVRAQCF
jgi:hypothetical protein